MIDTQRIFWVSLCVRRVRHRVFVSPAAGFRLSDAKPRKGHRRPRALQDELLDLLAIVTGTPPARVARIDLPVDEALRATAAHLLPAGPTYVGIAPGSGAELKCWPLERFAALAEAQPAKGRTPVLFLGPREAAWRADLRARFPTARFLLQEAPVDGNVPAYSPLLTVALAGRLAAAVSNDSGSAHLLAVGGAHLVVLYGPTAPGKYRPPTDCLTVVRAADFGGREMAAIPVASVLVALESALAQSTAGAAAATGAGGG